MFGDSVRAMAERATRPALGRSSPPSRSPTSTPPRPTCCEDLDEWLNDRGVSLVFAEMKDPVREKIERYELTRTIDPAHFYPTLDDAVAAYMAQTGATWQDAQPEGERP